MVMIYETIVILPKNASTWPAMPLIAFININGNACKQGWWQGSTTPSVLIANWRNFCVWLITYKYKYYKKY